jgi:hypothetical protein
VVEHFPQAAPQPFADRLNQVFHAARSTYIAAIPTRIPTRMNCVVGDIASLVLGLLDPRF